MKTQTLDRKIKPEMFLSPIFLSTSPLGVRGRGSGPKVRQLPDGSVESPTRTGGRSGFSMWRPNAPRANSNSH